MVTHTLDDLTRAVRLLGRDRRELATVAPEAARRWMRSRGWQLEGRRGAAWESWSLTVDGHPGRFGMPCDATAEDYPVRFVEWLDYAAHCAATEPALVLAEVLALAAP